MIWHPAPRGLITAAATERWTKEHPAPQLVAYLWIWSQYDDRERPTRRSIARQFGWSEYYAKQMLRRVHLEHAAWVAAFSPESKTAHRPRQTNDSSRLGDGIPANQPHFNQDSPDRAGAVTTHTQHNTSRGGEEIGEWPARR